MYVLLRVFVKFTGEKLGFVLRLTKEIKAEVTEKEEMIKMKTAKLGALFVVFVMAFTAVAASYAHWEETLTISGIMTTDDIDPYFFCEKTNDPAGEGFNPDPDGCGEWLADGWHGSYRNKDVGSCAIAFAYDQAAGAYDNNKLVITINDAYPCYYAHPAFCIGNGGSCPVHLKEVAIKELSFGWYDEDGNEVIVYRDVDIDLKVCKYYFVDWYLDGDNIWQVKVEKYNNGNARPEYDFFIHPTGDILVCTQLDPNTWVADDGHLAPGEIPDTCIDGDLCIHFENGCRQSHIYDFTIELLFYNWPE